MLIARIVHSESHTIYVGKVIEKREVENPPSKEDFAFGNFVKISAEAESFFGIIFDTVLQSPNNSLMSPISFPDQAREIFTPDQINTCATLIRILILGTLEQDKVLQGIAPKSISFGADVFKASEKEIEHFHRSDGKLKIGYFSHLKPHAGEFALPLFEIIIEKLKNFASSDEKDCLEVLRKAMTIQQNL
ncbi:MAG: hypothetical protein N2Z23_06125 [Pyrinomonadaceae bacterium]|nr:hypothetical protein [Pyrinomonadaceae bacterium]MCX7639999.1 hypothetical protein [Pyrinomonadaceae bacterium]MDW8304171.1 hypothetical protein [Acidobacteriota bacterium]